ncbi:MAG: hypothetical protein ACTJHC_02190, partial [Vagococcus sp.]
MVFFYYFRVTNLILQLSFSNDVEKGLYFTNEGLVIDELELKKGEKNLFLLLTLNHMKNRLVYSCPRM